MGDELSLAGDLTQDRIQDFRDGGGKALETRQGASRWLNAGGSHSEGK